MRVRSIWKEVMSQYGDYFTLTIGVVEIARIDQGKTGRYCVRNLGTERVSVGGFPSSKAAKAYVETKLGRQVNL